MRIDSSGNVGIGTSSPSSQLHLSKAGGTLIKLGTSLNTSEIEAREVGGGNSLVFSSNNSTDHLVIVDGGNVGIGTDSPARKLDVNAGSTSMVAQFKSTLSSSFVCFANSSSTADQVRLGSNGTALTFSTNYAERMRIDSSGNLLVGQTSSNGDKLEVQGNANVFAARLNGSTTGGQSYGLRVRAGINSSDVGLLVENISGTDLFKVRGDGNVGIGTSSPDGNLEVVASTTVSGASDSVNNVLIGLQSTNRPTIILDTADTTYTNRTWNITNVGSAGTLRIGRNGLDVMSLKNDGKIGIGTDSPSEKIHVVGGAAAVKIESSTNEASLKYDNSTTTGAIKLANNDLKTELGGSEVMRILANGNFGIGTSSPSAKLDVLGDDTSGASITWKQGTRHSGYLYSDTSGVAIYDTNLNNAGIYLASNNRMDFRVNGTERMRLDSSGELLAGKTSADNTTAGHRLSPSGFVSHVRSGNEVMILNRLSSDGSILTFRQDGENIGSIGVTGTDFYIGRESSSNLRFQSAGIRPSTGASLADDTYELGGASARFTNLHLANQVYINGTTPNIRFTDSDTGADSQITASSGYGALVLKADYNNETAGSYIGFEVDGSEAGRFDTSGNLLVGTTTAGYASQSGVTVNPAGASYVAVTHPVDSTSGNSYALFTYNAGIIGSITQNGTTGVSYNTSSDARLKDVTGEARGLEVITKLNPVAYNWKADGKADEGLIAQEVKELVPNAVTGSEDEHYQMDYSKLVTHLVKGMKEQQEQIEFLKEEIANLKGE
jgi:hypothetical protein